jgi:ribulose-phosphate 3-epimerase
MASATQLVPSILSADFSRLGEQVREVEAAGIGRIQIDIMDGHFVPNLTMGPGIVEAVRKGTKMILEAHLMISNPQDFIDTFAKAGADVIIIHQEASPHLHKLIKQIKAAGKQAGVALTPSTPIVMLQDILSLCDLILVMTVNPGFGGQEFIPEMLPKIAQLKQLLAERGLSCDIEVDGGINAETIPRVVQAGANLLVAGSSVYNNKESVEDAVKKLRNALSVKV